MSDDLVKQLRAEALIADEDWTGIYGISPNLAFAAADRIEKLEAALRILANITDCDTEGKLPVDTKLTWARQKLFDVRQLARKALDAK
jgi:hypothetical protein